MTTNTITPNLDCWQSAKHPQLFDYRVHFPSICLRNVYERCNEFKICRELFSGRQNVNLLDVGCASGEISRYFRRVLPWVHYTGCDISKTAIERAKQKYPQSQFIVTDFELSQVRGRPIDYLFCRDVVIHQPDPFAFLKLLSGIPQKGMILRLRTRDKGATELNPEYSCQLNYGGWAPYMVLNCDELITFFKQLGNCSKIRLMKNYMVLGGQHARFLPKDCYLPETGTAETAVYVEFAKERCDTDVINEVRKEDLTPPLWCRLARSGVKALTRKHQGKVWW